MTQNRRNKLRESTTRSTLQRHLCGNPSQPRSARRRRDGRGASSEVTPSQRARGALRAKTGHVTGHRGTGAPLYTLYIYQAILSSAHPLPRVAWLCMSSAMDSRQPGEVYAPNDNNNHHNNHHKSTTSTRPTALTPNLFQGSRPVSSIEYFSSYFFLSLLTIFCRCHHIYVVQQHNHNYNHEHRHSTCPLETVVNGYGRRRGLYGGARYVSIWTMSFYDFNRS